MPGLGRDDRIEGAALGVPVLESRHFNLDAVATGDCGHAVVDVHAEDGAAVRGELAGGDAGADAHVEDVRSGAGGDDRVDHGLGVVGAGAVVLLGAVAEGAGGFASGGGRMTMRPL